MYIGHLFEKKQPPLKLRCWNDRVDHIPPEKKMRIPGSLSLSLSLSTTGGESERRGVRQLDPVGSNHPDVRTRMVPYSGCTFGPVRVSAPLCMPPASVRCPPATRPPPPSCRVSKIDAIRTVSCVLVMPDADGRVTTGRRGRVSCLFGKPLKN